MEDKNYNPQQIEEKWRKLWEQEQLYWIDLKKAKKPFYNLMMFPYPSAEGLHVGNVYAFTGSDIYGRFKRMQGFDVFEPIGFDAFGIHSENFAIKQNIHPKVLIKKSVDNFRKQLKKMGAIFDWEHEVDTTKPDYYKWTQWLFLQLYKAGLAYRKKAPVDWCPSCKTVLADEQVISGKCERCDSQIIQKETEQWFLKITKYADRLLKNLGRIDWSETTKTIQENWIGRSEGSIIKFEVKTEKSKLEISVFTTRTDTLFGATYLVVAPEYPLIANCKSQIANWEEVEKYIEEAKNKTELERTELTKKKTGVKLKGIKAINPANNQEIPIFVADYVLSTYGTGAIMAVPGHDARDFEFAKKYNLPIIEVISPDGKEHFLSQAYEDEGILINSGEFNGMASEKARWEITRFVDGKKIANYHLRDWLISRQRYWGPPIPIIYCEKCGTVPVPEKELPVLLPDVEDFRPTGTGKSPLAQCKNWAEVACPKCGKPAKRETDVSDTFLDSSWYFFGYLSSLRNQKSKIKNKKHISKIKNIPWDRKLIHKWMPVSMYIGGQEHACLHLLYTRFITMALKDLGYLNFEEPFKKFRAHGLITKGGVKMSKSRGNIVNPDNYFEKYGADSLRMYLMFIGPFTEGGDWQDAGIIGIHRFLKKVWNLIQNQRLKIKDEKQKRKNTKIINRNLERLKHKTIRKVTKDIENLRYNTAISSLMVFVNEISKRKNLSMDTCKLLLVLLAPFAPHITEELWQKLGNKDSIHEQEWPKYDLKMIEEETFELVIQINGKVRDKVEVPVDISEKEAKDLTLSREKVKKWRVEREIKKVIFVKNKLINIVV